jgi:hypothetical protein
MSHKASFMTLSSTEYCGKMQTLEKLLETFHEASDKVIIFSMSVKVHVNYYYRIVGNFQGVQFSWFSWINDYP